MKRTSRDRRMPGRCRVTIRDGVWTAAEQVRLSDETYLPFGAPIPLTVQAAPAADVSLVGANLMLKSGLAVTTQPHAASCIWLLPLSSLVGWSEDIGTLTSWEITSTANFATINAFLGAGLVALSGAYNAAAETSHFISLGYGNTAHPTLRRCSTTGSWTAVDADETDTLTRVQQSHCEGGLVGSCRDIAGVSAVLTEGSNNGLAAASTHLAIVGFAQTATLLSDATMTEPAVTLYYGR